MPQKKSSSSKKPSAAGLPQPIRLQRFLAQAGHGSRRECEQLILEGRVTIGERVANELGTRVEPDSQDVKVDGSRIIPSRLQYFLVHKPTGVLSTCRDPEGRLRVIDLINTDQRVYNVGRLDKSSEGLILVTNDGELANHLTHPRYGVPKTYHVTVVGNPSWEDLQQLKRGIRLAEAVAKVSDVKVRKRRRESCDLALVLQEGRNREIRRLLAHIGHKVTHLRRVAIGPLQLGNLKAGDYRRLEPHEVEALTKASAHVQSRQKHRQHPVETSQLEGWKKKQDKRREASAAAERSGRPKKKRQANESATGRGGKTSANQQADSTQTRSTQRDRSTRRSRSTKSNPQPKTPRQKKAGQGRVTTRPAESSSRPTAKKGSAKKRTAAKKGIAKKRTTRKSPGSSSAGKKKASRKPTPQAGAGSRRGAGRLKKSTERKTKAGKKGSSGKSSARVQKKSIANKKTGRKGKSVSRRKSSKGRRR